MMGKINYQLSKIFSHLGVLVAIHPKKFIIFPVIATVIVGYGITQYKYIDDLQYLYTITGSENKQAGEVITKFFPGNPMYFDASRTDNVGRLVRIIAVDKNGGTILTKEIWNELIQLDEIVSSVEVDNRNFSSLCATWKDDCLSVNQFLEMDDIIPEIANGSLKLSYPVMFNLKTFTTYTLPFFLGGIELTDDLHSVTTAKAITLNYFARIGNAEDDKRGREWEAKVMEKLGKMDPKWKYIKVYRFSYFSFSNEGLETLILAMPAFLLAGALAALFAIITSMQSDCVRSKPMLGFFGLISTLLAIISAFGILCVIGIPMMLLGCIVPFILLGFGMDDTFVLLASWRQTNCRDPVVKRLSECYSGAAVSITITSVTGILGFFVGIFTPIPAVQLFSICAGTGLMFIYFWHIFFFGGIIAIYGYGEEKNKHSMFWWVQAISKSNSGSVSLPKRLFLTGGVDTSDPNNSANESENFLMTFFRDRFTTVISSKWGQAAVIGIYICYITMSLWGLAHLEDGIEVERLVRYDSDIAKYIEKQKQYFSTFGYRIQIVIGTPLDYSTNETQSRVNEMLQEIYGLDYFTNEYNENWLRDYTQYLNTYRDLYELNVTNEQEFNNFYLEQYSHDGMRTHLDVKFNEDNSSIIASRYIVQTKDVGKPNAMRDLVIDLRNTLKKYKDLNAIAFIPWFDFVDQGLLIRDLTLKMIIVVAVVVMAVTILFIPNLITSISVCFSIASIQLGILGFLSFLDVNLDIISLITMVTCIGFSVDFTTHISYSYTSSRAFSSMERIRETMYLVGLPIAQGAGTTLIEILGLLYIPSYGFQVCFKILFLVTIFTVFHSLFVLPVLFALLKPENFMNCFKHRKYSLETGQVMKF